MSPHVPIAHHPAATRIGRHHTADTWVGSKVDAKLQAVRLQRAIELRQSYAGLHDRNRVRDRQLPDIVEAPGQKDDLPSAAVGHRGSD